MVSKQKTGLGGPAQLIAAGHGITKDKTMVHQLTEKFNETETNTVLPIQSVDSVEVSRTLNLFCGDLTEIRLLKCQRSYGRPFTVSGYFDRDHFTVAAEQLVALDKELKPAGIYFTFNEIHPGCHARGHNRFQEYPASTTGDKEVVRRRWIFVDIDPPRPAGVSSSAKEKADAVADRELIFDALKKFAESIVCDSGNGWHLFVPVDIANTSEADHGIESILQGLHKISDLVDVTTSNAARLTKLYGTVARKGDNTLTRPHRQAVIVYVPDYLNHGWSAT